MTNLLANRDTTRVDEHVFPDKMYGGVAAAAVLYAGAMVGFSATGYVVRAGAAVRVAGRNNALRDNTSGADGALVAEIRRGVFAWNMGAGADALTIANILQPVYVIDDNTVGATSSGGTRVLAGYLHNVVGNQAYVQTGFPSPLTGASGGPRFETTKVVDAAAGTATGATPFAVARQPLLVTGATILPGGALTADDTNNAMITVFKSTAGGAGVAVAAITTNVASGNWVALTAKAMTLSVVAGALNLATGDVLYYTITKGGTGVAVPISGIQLDTVPA